ncbi:MAG: response regulator transcription factor, partial [Motiliproteus sp.]
MLASPHHLTDGERREPKQGTGVRCKSNSGIELICFEFDYPDLQSLNLLKRTREKYPQIPIIMLTLQHSEALAVWALRLHVWDFLVKPISESQVADVAEAIRSVKTTTKSGGSAYDIPNVDCKVPQDLRFQPEKSGADSLKLGLRLIRDRLGERISEQQVADACGLGLFTFSKAFKRLMGQTFQDYVMQQRIIESMRLLMHPNATITEIAYLVGFRDISYFSKIFKRSVG